MAATKNASFTRDMVELTPANLDGSQTIFQSSRLLFDVLVGENPTEPIHDAISSGDNSKLQSLLAEPKWTKVMLEESFTIFYQSRPRKDDSDVREVDAKKLSNVKRAIIYAAECRQGVAVRKLLDFASQQGLETSSVITRWALDRALNDAAVIEAMASAYPEIVSSSLLGHGRTPLEQARKRHNTEVVDVLLRFGAQST